MDMCFTVNNEALGSLIREYRKESLGITMTEVAKRTGYTISNVSLFETGKVASLNLFVWYLRMGFPVSDLQWCSNMEMMDYRS